MWLEQTLLKALAQEGVEVKGTVGPRSRAPGVAGK